MTPLSVRSFPRWPSAALRSGRIPLFAAVCLAVTAPQSVWAQAAERGPVVLGIGTGARAEGLGGAFQPGANDPNAAFVNPALAAIADGFRLGFERFDTEGTAASLSTASDWYGGGVFGAIQVLDWNGAPAGQYPGGLDPLLEAGQPGSTELALSAGYGRSLFGVRAGIGAKYLMQRIGDSNAATVAVDLGLAQRLGPGWIHFAVRNLGEATNWSEGDVELPTEVALGWGAYGRPLGPLDVGGAIDVTRRADGEWLTRGGLEFGYWPVRGRTFVGRVGLRSVPEGDASPVSFGGSFWGDSIVLDYAFHSVDGTDGVHRFTLGWR